MTPIGLLSWRVNEEGVSSARRRRLRRRRIPGRQPDEPAEAKPGLESVGGGERSTEQRQEAVEEAVVLDEITRHYDLGHGSGEQLLDEAMPPACDQSGSLASRKVSVKRSGMGLVPAESRSSG